MAHLKEKAVLVTGAAGAIGVAVRSASGTTIVTDDALVEVT